MKFENVRVYFGKNEAERQERTGNCKKIGGRTWGIYECKGSNGMSKVSKTYLYKMLEEENIIYFVSGRRKIIYTRSLLVILR